MKIANWRMRSALAIAVIGLATAPLAAGSTSGALTVSVTVEESCHLTTQPLVFPAVAPEHDRVDARSAVALTCTPAANYVITLDDGRHGAGGTRRMADASGTHFVAYELYSDAARSRRWGASAASAVGAVAPADGRAELAVYARLSAVQARAGAYSDTVTVTVAF